MKHTIPLGTPVSFGITGYSKVYIVDLYQTLIGPCPPDCKFDHDCYDEPYITVREQSWTAFPFSKLETVFDPQSHFGRPFDLAEFPLIK